MTRFAQTRNAPLRACVVLRIDLEAHELPAVLQRRNRHCAASHERIEDEALAGAARQHHALDNLERLLGRMILAFRILAVNPRHAPHVLRVIAHLEPFLADENRARSRALCFRVVRNAHAVNIEKVVLRASDHADRVMEGGEFSRAAAHARHFPVPDDLVHHRQARLQITEDFRTVLPGQKNVKAAAGLEFRNHGVDPAPAEVEIGVPAQAVRVVQLVLAEAVRRIGGVEIHARLGDADDAVEQISVEERCVRVAQNWIPDFSASMCMSLSPRPERLTRRILSLGSDGASFAAWASACADSRAGMMPSLRHRSWNAATASPSSMVTYRSEEHTSELQSPY